MFRLSFPLKNVTRSLVLQRFKLVAPPLKLRLQECCMSVLLEWIHSWVFSCLFGQLQLGNLRNHHRFSQIQCGSSTQIMVLMGSTPWFHKSAVWLKSFNWTSFNSVEGSFCFGFANVCKSSSLKKGRHSISKIGETKPNGIV